MRITEKIPPLRPWMKALVGHWHGIGPEPGPDRELPGTWRTAIWQEIGRAFHPPYEVPFVVVINAALVCFCWFLLPLRIQDMVFSVHGSLAFPMVLASWMFSDVPATNVLGGDAARLVPALDDHVMVGRLLWAKGMALWLLAAVPASVVAIALGFGSGRWSATFVTVVWILVVPLGALGISSWIGIWWPYHPLPVRFRWEHRRPVRHMVVRWGVLTLVPYGIVPVLTLLLVTPSVALWSVWAQNGLSGRLSDGELAAGVALSVVLAVGAGFAGHRIGVLLVGRRVERLRTYLGDPERG